MTVDIAAGPAEDSAGNPSAAANQFSITTDLTPVPALPLAGAIVLGEAHPKWPPAIFAAGRGRVVRKRCTGTGALDRAAGTPGRTHRPPPAGAGSVVNRCGGGWSAVADAPSAPSQELSRAVRIPVRDP